MTIEPLRAVYQTRPFRPFTIHLAMLVIGLGCVTAAAGADLSLVPLWDGETAVVPDGPLINRYGGQPVFGGGAGTSVSRSTSQVHSGSGSYRIQTLQPIPAGGFGFFQTALVPGSSSSTYTPGRNLTRFDQASFWLKNDTGAPFRFKLEFKDYRDSGSQQAYRFVNVPSGSNWQSYSIPLDFSAPGWNVVGNPDPERMRFLGFVIEPNQGQAVNGSMYLDDLVLRERGGTLDSQTASLTDLAARLAERQFDTLWSSRNRVNGLVPLGSTAQNAGAMNTTSALVQMLPGAVERGWVAQSVADNYMSTLVTTLNAALNRSNYLPPRYMNMDTLAPTIPEESSVDAAFMALALHQYKSLPTTAPSLRSAIDAVQNRFNFAAFSDTQAPTTGWKLAFQTDTQTFTAGTYDGYSGEPWLISLAAHLADDHHVDIRTHYHSAVFRQAASLVHPTDAHLVHSFDQFRAPFLQWLMPLFVDVSERGIDTYPNYALASNPLENAERYQREVDAWFAQQGRALFAQPDAGSDVGGTTYEQFSAYNNFGQPDLFMPWSVAFGLLGDPGPAGIALRNAIESQLYGPLGLSDSVTWTTGAAGPSDVTARHDFWNTALSAMALARFVYQDQLDFTHLPEVEAALDRVFYLTWDGTGDANWNSSSWGGGMPRPTGRHDAEILSDTVTVTGTQLAHRTRVSSGRLDVDGTLISPLEVLVGAAISGTGTVQGDVTLRGSFQIESPQDALTITGSLVLDATSEITIDDPEWQPRGTSTGPLAIVSAAQGVEGEFATPANAGVDSHLGSGHFLMDIDYGTSDVVVEILSAVEGDANGDRVVDGSDFGIWNANKFRVGTDWTTGDFNHDGITDGTDFNLWNAAKFTNYQDAWQRQSPNSTVPEPHPTWLIVAMSFATLGRARGASRSLGRSAAWSRLA